jgi:hypothetical protein
MRSLNFSLRPLRLEWFKSYIFNRRGTEKADVESFCPNILSTLTGLAHILHLGQKPGFLRITLLEKLNLTFRNPVFLVLLRMVQDVS